MNLKSTWSERGTTLIESMVAISIFGLAMTALTNLMVTHMRVVGSNLTQTTAIGLAERELEDLRSIDYADIGSRTSTQTIGGTPYTVTTTVTADVPVNSMKTLNTVVTWTDRFGSQSFPLAAVYTAIRR